MSCLRLLLILLSNILISILTESLMTLYILINRSLLEKFLIFIAYLHALYINYIRLVGSLKLYTLGGSI